MGIPSAPERFLEPAQVAELLQLSVADVLDLVSQGQLRGTQIGSPPRWRIQLSAVQDYVDEQVEHSRRMALWRQSQTASFPELWGTGKRLS